MDVILCVFGALAFLVLGFVAALELIDYVGDENE